jgi:hypothetical protein
VPAIKAGATKKGRIRCSLAGSEAQDQPAFYVAANRALEKVIGFVIPSEAKNLSSIQYLKRNKERFFASLRMTTF